MRRLLSPLLVLAATAFVACDASKGPTAAPSEDTAPRIELLGFPDCPNTPPMRTALVTALATVNPRWSHTDINLAALALDDRRRTIPAPTILVNGHDLFGVTPSAGEGLGCRVYPGGIPTAAEITRRLTEALAR